MAEEQRCQAPEGHILCANNCGFFGSSATLNLCSKCYRDYCLKEQQASSAKIAVEKSLAGSSSSSSSVTVPLPSAATVTFPLPGSVTSNQLIVPETTPAELQAPAVSNQPNRCSTCRKRVGLTGFKCRCGVTFCMSHRYPEQHGCSFDFKSVGREAIAKANPIVKAEKLDKI